MCIAWWNTGLSPTRDPDRAKPKDYQTAAAVLLHLIHEVRADLIVLGEMAPSSVAGLQEACPISRSDYVWFPFFQTAGRSRFSLCILGRKGYVKVGFRSPIVDDGRGPVVKVGMHFRAQLAEGDPPLEVIAAHWPSRLHLDRQDSARTHIASFLRRWIDQHLFRLNPQANVVVLGDFNDEPFDEGIERYLRASRDRLRVERNPKLLYNPFWRHLSSFGGGGSTAHLSDPGTYFHAKGEFSYWRTFDPLIVSSSLLLSRSGWRMNEQRTRVLSLPALDDLVGSGSSLVDHLPIVGHFERHAS